MSKIPMILPLTEFCKKKGYKLRDSLRNTKEGYDVFFFQHMNTKEWRFYCFTERAVFEDQADADRGVETLFETCKPVNTEKKEKEKRRLMDAKN